MKDKLNILWTNDNVLTAENMLFMYANNSIKKGLWGEINIIIWGATAKLVGENKHVQDMIKEAQSNGIHICACKACAENFGVAKTIEDMNVKLIYMAIPFTDIIKGGEHLITI